MSVTPFHEYHACDREAVNALLSRLIAALNNHKQRHHATIQTILIATSEMIGIVAGTIVDDFGKTNPESDQEEFKASILAMIAAHIDVAEREAMVLEE